LRSAAERRPRPPVEFASSSSPYQTRHFKRLGDYVFTITTPEPFDGELVRLMPVRGASEQFATA
jgi:hypothetical protein